MVVRQLTSRSKGSGQGCIGGFSLMTTAFLACFCLPPKSLFAKSFVVPCPWLRSKIAKVHCSVICTLLGEILLVRTVSGVTTSGVSVPGGAALLAAPPHLEDGYLSRLSIVSTRSSHSTCGTQLSVYPPHTWQTFSLAPDARCISLGLVRAHASSWSGRDQT